MNNLKRLKNYMISLNNKNNSLIDVSVSNNSLYFFTLVTLECDNIRLNEEVNKLSKKN